MRDTLGAVVVSGRMSLSAFSGSRLIGRGFLNSEMGRRPSARSAGSRLSEGRGPTKGTRSGFGLTMRTTLQSSSSSPSPSPVLLPSSSPLSFSGRASPSSSLSMRARRVRGGGEGVREGDWSVKLKGRPERAPLPCEQEADRAAVELPAPQPGLLASHSSATPWPRPNPPCGAPRVPRPRA